MLKILFFTCIFVILRLDQTYGGRGEYIKGIFLTPHPPITDAVPNKMAVQIRRSRGEMLKDKIMIRIPVTESTTTKTTTTKSPAQIRKEIEIEKRNKDPKGFGSKLIEMLKVEKEAEEMSEKLHSMLNTCVTNEDCGNNTCCFKEDENGPGECRMTPHQVDQRCSNLCGCVGKDLECTLVIKNMKSRDYHSKNKKQCTKKVVVDKWELFQRGKSSLKDEYKKGKQKGKRTKRTKRLQLNRITFF